MAKKEFQAESRRLLELMINSIYTHQDLQRLGRYRQALLPLADR